MLVERPGQLDQAGIREAVSHLMQTSCAARAAWLLLHDAASNELITIYCHGPAADGFRGARIPCTHVAGLAFRSRQPVFEPSGIHAVLAVPLIVGGESIGVLGVDSESFSAERPPGAGDIARLHALGTVAAVALRNARDMERLEEERHRIRRIAGERRQLRTEVGHLRQQIREAQWPTTLIGDGRPFRDIRAQVEVVAPADTSVLLVGETGTGKELIARAIHDQSGRAGRPFVAINCAALPESLIESELFGYEKGAFTGAIERRAGKFELAHLGTIFLDEIGDLPAQAQAKLLRVLQERAVQRIGGTKPLPVDVRVVAATNQDLEQSMQDGRFRADLFYRLSVFPLRLPSLRERREDIPALVTHFVARFADQQHKRVPDVSTGAMAMLLAYDWPGNVRELQNVVERAIILTRGGSVDPSAIMLGTHAVAISNRGGHQRALVRHELPALQRHPTRLSDAERGAIVGALERTGWRVSGPDGAAAVLDLKPTTLHAKMKKLGIRRPSLGDASGRAATPSAP